MFSVNKSSCLVPESPLSLFNCIMGNFAGFPGIINISGNLYSLFSAPFYEMCSLVGDRWGVLDDTICATLKMCSGVSHCSTYTAENDFPHSLSEKKNISYEHFIFNFF